MGFGNHLSGETGSIDRRDRTQEQSQKYKLEEMQPSDMSILFTSVCAATRDKMIVDLRKEVANLRKENFRERSKTKMFKKLTIKNGKALIKT